MAEQSCPACGYQYSSEQQLDYCPICGFSLGQNDTLQESASHLSPDIPHSLNHEVADDTKDRVTWNDIETDVIQSSAKVFTVAPEKKHNIVINTQKKLGHRNLEPTAHTAPKKDRFKSNIDDVFYKAPIISKKTENSEQTSLKELTKSNERVSDLIATNVEMSSKNSSQQIVPNKLIQEPDVAVSIHTVENSEEGESRHMSKKKKKNNQQSKKSNEQQPAKKAPTEASAEVEEQLKPTNSEVEPQSDEKKETAEPSINEKETPTNDDIQWSEFEEMPIGSVKDILDEDLNDSSAKLGESETQSLKKFTSDETEVSEQTSEEETVTLGKREAAASDEKDSQAARPKKLTAKEIIERSKSQQKEQENQQPDNQILAQYMKEHRHEYTSEEVAAIEEEQAAADEKEAVQQPETSLEDKNQAVVDNESPSGTVDNSKDSSGNNSNEVADKSVADTTQEVEKIEVTEEIETKESQTDTTSELDIKIQDIQETEQTETEVATDSQVAADSSIEKTEPTVVDETATPDEAAKPVKFSVKDKLPVFGEKELAAERARVEAELAQIVAQQEAAKKAAEEAEKAKVERVAKAVENAENIKREKEIEKMIQEKEEEDARRAQEREKVRLANEKAKADATLKLDDATPSPLADESPEKKVSVAPAKSVFPERQTSGDNAKKTVKEGGGASGTKAISEKNSMKQAQEAQALSESRSANNNRKKWIYAGLAAVVLLGAVGAGYAYQNYATNQEQATQESISNALDDLTAEIDNYYTDDTQVYVKANQVNNDLDALKDSIDQYESSDRYDTLTAAYDQLEEKVTAIRRVNNLFTAPVINGDALAENPLLASGSAITVTEQTGTDGLSTLLNQALTEANSQYQTLQAAIQAVAVVYADGAVVSGMTTEQFNNAVAAVAAVKNQELVTDLLSQLEQVNSSLTGGTTSETTDAGSGSGTSEGSTSDGGSSATGSGSSASSASGSTASGSTSSGSSSSASGGSSSGSTSSGSSASTPSYSGSASYTIGDNGALVGFVMNSSGNPIVESNPVDIANTSASAWVWGDGVLESVLAVCRERGYFSGDNYALEPALIVDGYGFYNLYRVESDGSRSYLVTINDKTSWFKGNGPGGPHTRVN